MDVCQNQTTIINEWDQATRKLTTRDKTRLEKKTSFILIMHQGLILMFGRISFMALSQMCLTPCTKKAFLKRFAERALSAISGPTSSGGNSGTRSIAVVSSATATALSDPESLR